MLLQNQVTIKDYESYYDRVNQLFNKTKEQNMGGFIPTSSPQFAKADPEGFGVSI